MLGGLSFDGRAALVAELLPEAGVEDAQVVVDLGDRADRRARVDRGRLLLDRDRGREAADLVELRLLLLAEELARVGREALDEASPALGVDRVDRERGLARTRGSGEHHELLLGNPDGDSLQVVLTSPGHEDLVGFHNCSLSAPLSRART